MFEHYVEQSLGTLCAAYGTPVLGISSNLFEDTALNILQINLISKLN